MGYFSIPKDVNSIFDNVKSVMSSDFFAVHVLVWGFDEIRYEYAQSITGAHELQIDYSVGMLAWLRNELENYEEPGRCFGYITDAATDEEDDHRRFLSDLAGEDLGIMKIDLEVAETDSYRFLIVCFAKDIEDFSERVAKWSLSYHGTDNVPSGRGTV